MFSIENIFNFIYKMIIIQSSRIATDFDNESYNHCRIMSDNVNRPHFFYMYVVYVVKISWDFFP